METNLQANWSPDLQASALLGDLARPVFHASNNLLNNMLLQFALLEESLPKSAITDLDSIKGQAQQLARFIAAWQSYQVPKSRGTMEVSLPDVCDEVLKVVEDRFPVANVKIAVSGPRPLVVTSELGALKRLCYFLFTDAILSSQEQSQQGLVEIRFDSSPNVELQIDDNRIVADPVAFDNWFELEFPPGKHTVQLAACPSLAMRCHARIKAERSLLGGARVVVAFLNEEH